MMGGLSADRIQAAQARLKTVVRRTPFEKSPELSERTKATVYLKMECLQKTGSFKIRGAYNRIALLGREARAAGIVTSSAGNHAQGVGLAAERFGIPARIFIPQTTPTNKIEAVRRYPVELIVAGKGYDEAHAAALADAEKTGRTYIGAFEDLDVIAGHGTIGLEMIAAVPDLDAVLIPVGGGGLIAGCATALKAAKPGIRVVGCQSKASCAMTRSLAENRVYLTFPSEETIAEGLEGGIGELTFELGRQLIDEMVLVEEADIRSAIRFLLAHHRLVVEGSGAVGVAALLHNRWAAPGTNVGVVLSGGNLEFGLLTQIVGNQCCVPEIG